MGLFKPKRAVVDWTVIKEISIERLLREEDEDEVEKLDAAYDMLIECDPGSALKRDLVKLFKVCQMLLELKGEDNRQLEVELVKTEEELRLAQRALGATDPMDFAKMEELQQTVEQRDIELREAAHKLREAQQEVDKLTEDLAAKDDQMEELHAELEREQTASVDYLHQIEAQRKALHAAQHKAASGATVAQEDFLAQRREMSKLVEQLEEASEANTILNEQVAELRQALSVSTAQLDAAAKRLDELQRATRDAERNSDALQRERDTLAHRVDELRSAARMKAESDDQILGSVNDTVAQWKRRLGEKDAQIAAAHQIIASLRQTLEVDSVDRQNQLENALAAREAEISVLKEQLAKAVKDIDHLAVTRDRHGVNSGAEDFTKEELWEQLQEARRHTRQAQEITAQKEVDLVEARKRLTEYEQGVYGLKEAVQDVKHLKTQIGVRDENIAELTRQQNALIKDNSDLSDENDAYRLKLGLGSREIKDDLVAELHYKRNVEMEQLRTVNRHLTKDVERLEAERLDLKRRLIKQAMARGERAVELGLTADDLALLEGESLSNVVVPDDRPPAANSLNHTGERDASAQRRLQHDLLQQQRKVDDLQFQLVREADARAHHANRVMEVEAENSKMRAALEEALGRLEGDSRLSSGQELEAVQELREWLQRHAAVPRHVGFVPGQQQGGAGGASDGHTLAELQGANKELRGAVASLQNELRAALQASERSALRVQQLQAANETLKQQARWKPVQLPDQITSTATDVIAALNEQLLEVMEELHQRHEELRDAHQHIERCNEQSSVAVHQQGLLYEEHAQAKQTFEATVFGLEQQLSQAQERAVKASVYENQYHELLERLSHGPDELKRNLADVSNKNVLLKVNEQMLTRRHRIQVQTEEELRKTVASLREQLIDLHASVQKRVAHLEQVREQNSLQINALQDKLEASVGLAEFDSLKRQSETLAVKYRCLLKYSNGASGPGSDWSQNAVHKLQDERALLEKKLHLAHEESEKLKAAMTQHRGRDEAQQRLALVEMQAQEHKQRADLLSVQYQQATASIARLESRCAELDAKVADLMASCLDAQEKQHKLQSDLEGTVRREDYEAARERLSAMESQHASTQQEMKQLKQVAAIAAEQAERRSDLKRSNDKELASLRRQLVELQMASDDKATIGQLHRHIISLQMSEMESVRKMERLKKSCIDHEARELQLLLRVEHLQNSLWETRERARSQTQHLRTSLQAMRIEYAGCSTLDQQERVATALREARAKETELVHHVKEATRQRQLAEQNAECLHAKHQLLEELVSTLEKGAGAQKLIEWHRKMTDLRLSEIRATRELQHTEERNKFLESQLEDLHKQLSDVETDSVKLAQQAEQRQMQWEKRESELERALETLEKDMSMRVKQVSDIRRLAEQGGTLHGIPDASLPLADQLDAAISQITLLSAAQAQTAAEKEQAVKKAEDAELQAKRAQAAVLRHQKEVHDLKLRLAEMGCVAPDVMSAKDETLAPPIEEPLEHSLAVAQQTITSLREILAQRDDMLENLRRSLSETQQSFQRDRDGLAAQIASLNQQLHKERAAATSLPTHVSESDQPAVVRDLMDKAREQQTVVSRQEQEILLLQSRLDESRAELQRAKAKLGEAESQAGEDASALERELAKMRTTLEATQRDLEQANGLVRHVQDQAEASRREVDRLNATKEPGLVERLRIALKSKDDQLTDLRAALATLKAEAKAPKKRPQQDITTAARAASAVVSQSSEQLRALQTRLDELQAKSEKAQASAKKYKAKAAEAEAKHKALEDEVATSRLRFKELQTHLRDLETKNKELNRQVAQLEKQFETNPEVEELRRQLAVLQSAQRRTAGSSTRNEQPLSAGSEQSVKQWEADKRLQRKIEALKTKLQTKEKDIERLTQQNEKLQQAGERLEREKSQLQARLKECATALSKTKAQAEQPDPAHLQRVLDLQRENERLSSEISQLHRLRSDKPTAEQAAAELDKLHRLEQQVLELQKVNMELEFDCSQLPRLRSRVEELTEALHHAESQVDAAASHGDATTRAQLTEMMQANEKLMTDNTSLRDEMQRLRRQLRSKQQPGDTGAAPAQQQAALEERLKAAVAEQKQMAEEHQRLVQENEQLRSELDSFDPAFFEEIEDLKFNYRQALELNRRYEAELRQRNT